jgi:hypothetical protein
MALAVINTFLLMVTGLGVVWVELIVRGNFNVML